MAARRQRSRHRKAPDPLAAVLGARVKALRGERGFSFDAFVGESELGRGYVSQMERGLVVPTYTTLLRIARALELTLVDLLASGTSPVERFINAARDLDPADVERLVRAAERLAAKRRAKEEAPRVLNPKSTSKRESPKAAKRPVVRARRNRTA